VVSREEGRWRSGEERGRREGRNKREEGDGDGRHTSFLSSSAWVVITLSLSMVTACLVVSNIPNTLVNI